MYRPAWRMNQTGVASTGCRRQALRKRLPDSVSACSEEIAREADKVLEPEWLESQFRTQFVQLHRHRVVKEVIAGDDGDRCGARVVLSAEPAEEAETVQQRHPQVEDDRVGMALCGLAETSFRADGRPDVIALEPKHARERLRDALIIVDNQNLGGDGLRHKCRHVDIVTDA